MRDAGRDVAEDSVRRAHALLMLLLSGLSAIPFEHLAAPPSPELVRISGQRAEYARFIVDLVAVTD